MRDPPSLLSSLGFMDSMDEDAVDDDDEDDDKDDYDGDDNDDHFSLSTEAAYEERVLFFTHHFGHYSSFSVFNLNLSYRR